MRKNLAKFLLRIAIVTILLGTSQLNRSYGHDLPNYLPYHELGADCLGVQAVRVRAPVTPCEAIPDAIQPEDMPAKAEKSPPTSVQPSLLSTSTRFQLASPSSSLALGLASYDSAWKSIYQFRIVRQALQQFESTPFLPFTTAVPERFPQAPLAALLPDPLPAPLPPPLAAIASSEIEIERIPTKRNYVEDYMPYDMCIRDWRFGQYSYRGLSRLAHLQPPIAEVTERAQFEIHHQQPTTAEGLAHAAILSDAIGRIEDFQCLIFSQICGMNAAYEFGALSANSIQQVTRHTFRQVTQLALRVPAKTSQPFFTAPQYVVYELDGKPFVLRVEQVLEWQAYRTALLKSNSPPQATVESFSIRKSILSVASQQLENLGHQFLNLASTLDSFSQLKVAGRDEPSMR